MLRDMEKGIHRDDNWLYSTMIQRGGCTQEYLEDVACLCRKFRGWIFDKYDNALSEFKEKFRGKKQKDFEDIIVNYLAKKLADEELIDNND